MSSSNNRRKKAKKVKPGFDSIAEILDSTFYDLMKSTPPTALGSIRTAYKSLKTTFTASIKGIKVALTTPSIHSRAGIYSTPSIYSRAGISSTPSPHLRGVAVTTPSTSGSERSTRQSANRSNSGFHSIDDAMDLNDGYVDRLDGGDKFVSTSDHGMKRLRISHVLQLRVGDKFTLLVPPTDRRQHRSAIKPRNEVTNQFRNIIIANADTRNMSSDDKDDYFTKALQGRAIPRDGKDHHEYNVRITSHPERRYFMPHRC